MRACAPACRRERNRVRIACAPAHVSWARRSSSIDRRHRCAKPRQTAAPPTCPTGSTSAIPSRRHGRRRGLLDGGAGDLNGDELAGDPSGDDVALAAPSVDFATVTHVGAIPFDFGKAGGCGPVVDLARFVGTDGPLVARSGSECVLLLPASSRNPMGTASARTRAGPGDAASAASFSTWTTAPTSSASRGSPA